jgi:hypothetical protein
MASSLIVVDLIMGPSFKKVKSHQKIGQPRLQVVESTEDLNPFLSWGCCIPKILVTKVLTLIDSGFP